MDGVLIDSEPLWQDAEIEIFGGLGVPIDREACLQTQGLRMDEVVAHWHRLSPWPASSLEQVGERLAARVAGLIEERGEPMPGALAAVRRVKHWGARMALASSSPYRNIQAVLRRLQLTESFEFVRSAEEEAYGKPHPAIYLRAAELLHLPPHHCIAIEDSVNGLIAAKAARMRCIAVPEPALRNDPRYSIADAVIDSLQDLDGALLSRLAT